MINYRIVKVKNPKGIEGTDYFAGRAVKTSDYTFKEIRKYYDRKMAEGKAYGVVANAIKFKLLLRMFAVIKRGTPFVRKPDFIYS